MMKIHIVTAEQEVYRSTACSVVATTTEGELKIMANHAPLLALLRPGILRIDCLPGCHCPEIKRDEMFIHGGFIEVQATEVTILADTIERSEDIDARRAQQAVQDAREQFRTASPQQADMAIRALEIAVARLTIARNNRGQSRPYRRQP